MPKFTTSFLKAIHVHFMDPVVVLCQSKLTSALYTITSNLMD